ncbi:MAG: GGDEF domain-containing protein, partial [Planctomycetota bacterium]|nr:GGDEF domain-containing protein [Planctomycetota bacterium]
MTILERFAQLPIWLRLLIKALLIAVLGIIDHLTGYEIAFSIFYLVPVAVTAWIDGRAAGIAISLVSSAVWLLTDLTAGHEYSQPWIPFWNMGVRMGFFAIVAIILARLRAALERERDLARIDGLTQIW